MSALRYAIPSMFAAAVAVLTVYAIGVAALEHKGYELPPLEDDEDEL